MISPHTPPSRLHRYRGRLRESIAHEGIMGALRQIVASMRWRLDPAHHAVRAVMHDNDAFDAQHGTDTRGEIPLEQLGVAPDQAKHGNGVYRAISTSHFQAAMALVGQPFENCAFIDYGSGKGKALLLASDYPFRRIIGVEYSSALYQTSLENLRCYGESSARCRTIEVIKADARHYQPPEEPLICFFFNPFDASIWRPVLRRLEQQYRLNGLPIHLVYVNIRNVAELEDVFHDFPSFVSVIKTQTVHVLSAINTPHLAPSSISV